MAVQRRTSLCSGLDTLVVTLAHRRNTSGFQKHTMQISGSRARPQAQFAVHAATQNGTSRQVRHTCDPPAAHHARMAFLSWVYVRNRSIPRGCNAYSWCPIARPGGACQKSPTQNKSLLTRQCTLHITMLPRLTLSGHSTYCGAAVSSWLCRRPLCKEHDLRSQLPPPELPNLLPSTSSACRLGLHMHLKQTSQSVTHEL
jgi:hypothetical protein